MAAEFTSVADLFATLGLDTTGFEESLLESRVRLQDLAPQILTVQQLLKKMGEQATASGLSVEKLSEGVQELYIEGREQAQLFDTQMQALNESRLRSIAAIREEREVAQGRYQREIDLMAESNLATREMAAQRKALVAEEAASEEEYAALKRQLMAEEAAGVRALAQEKEDADRRYTASFRILLRQQEEEHEAAFSVYMASLEARRIASVASITEEADAERALAETRIASAEANEVLSASVLRGNNTSFASYRQTRMEAMALNDIAGTKIPFALSGLIATSPVVAQALQAIFAPVLALAFIDILYDVGKRIEELIDDYEGFDKASIKAWDDAEKGTEKARQKLIDYHEAMIDLNEDTAIGPLAKAQFKGFDNAEKIKYVQSLIESAKEEKAVYETYIKSLNDTNQSIGDSASRFLNPVGATVAIYQNTQAAIVEQDKLKRKIEEIAKYQEEVGKLILKQKADEGKAIAELQKEEDKLHKSRQDKMRDEIHEYPNRLPWFLGSSPAQSFAAQMGSRGSVTAQPPPMMGQSQSSSGSSDAAAASSPAQIQSNKSSSGINVQNVFNLSYKFEGVPADIQAFMRNEAEPMLVADMEKNTRGITASIVKALNAAGMGAKS